MPLQYTPIERAVLDANVEFLKKRRVDKGLHVLITTSAKDRSKDLVFWFDALASQVDILKPGVRTALETLIGYQVVVQRAVNTRVQVKVGSQIVVDSPRVFEVKETGHVDAMYVEVGDVDPKLLRASETVTLCPFKGLAHYYDLVLEDGTVVADAMWHYDQVLPGAPEDSNVLEVQGKLAFDKSKVDVRVFEEPKL